MKVVFFGSGDFITPVTETLKKNFELVQIVTPQIELSEKADVGIVASYGKILQKEIIDSFPHGILNIHPSLLPKYRGPTPVQTAILNGDKITGVTIIKIDEEVDHGPILAQKEIEIKENETSESLLKKTFAAGAKMLPKVLSNYIKGEIKLSSQNDSKATFTQHLTKEDGYIDLQKVSNSLEIENWKLKIARMVRAYYPWPGVWFKTKLGEQNRIVKLLPEKKIQVEGKKPMTYKDFINGYKEAEGILSKLGVS